jgi:hypothetical protein
MGSTNAQRFAINHPERIRGLVLAGSFASYRGNPAVVEFWESAVSRLTDPIDPAFVRQFQESTLARPMPPAFLDMVVQESLKVPARVWRAAFEGFLEDDVAGALGRIQAPTLIVWGTRDSLCRRADQDDLLAAIAGFSARGVRERRACPALGGARALRGRSGGLRHSSRHGTLAPIRPAVPRRKDRQWVVACAIVGHPWRRCIRTRKESSSPCCSPIWRARPSSLCARTPSSFERSCPRSSRR